MNNYYIKDGYTENTVAYTMDIVSGENYWNRMRIKSSEVYQFYVYKYANLLISNYHIKNIIDVGCGAAKKLEYIHKLNAKLNIIGVDQKCSIDYCKRNYTFGTWVKDHFEQPTPTIGDLSAEFIICSDVIEHIEKPDTLLNYIKRRMSSDGLLLLSTPDRDLLRGKDCMRSENKYHIREWNFTEIESYLESCGFEIIEHFHQYPVKFSLNRIFFNEIIKRFFSGKALKYNQVLLLRKK